MKMLKYTFAILALIALASCSDVRDQIMDSFMDKPTKDAFKVYHLLFKKEYELNSEEGGDTKNSKLTSRTSKKPTLRTSHTISVSTSSPTSPPKNLLTST